MRRLGLLSKLALGLALAALCAGCGIDVDLTSTPATVHVGEPVTFDIAMTNRSSCPVGNVTAILVPFVPKDFLISRISDPNQQAQASAAADAFCTGGDYTVPGGMAECQIIDGEIICMVGGDTSGSTSAASAVMTTVGGDEIHCDTNASGVTCHIPPSIAGMGEHMAADSSSETTANSLSPVVCGIGPNGHAGACFTLKLDAGETKTGQLVFTPIYGGTLHNWTVAFSTKNNGVCKTAKNVPCEDINDCPGQTDCLPGICVGGDLDGYGCNSNGDCETGGVCSPCTTPEDGQVLSGLACTTTDAIGYRAPAMSPWALAFAALVLLAMGYLGFRQGRRLW